MTLTVLVWLPLAVAVAGLALPQTAARSVAGPAFGLPSWSPPIQLPKRSGSGAPGIRRR